VLTALIRTSSSRPVHLRSERVRELWGRGLGGGGGGRPGPLGFLCTGGLAFATMTGGRTAEGMVCGRGGGRGYREDGMKRRELIYRTGRGGRRDNYFIF